MIRDTGRAQRVDTFDPCNTVACRTPWRGCAGCWPPCRPGARRLERFLAKVPRDGAAAELWRRAALASSLLAGLELEREGPAPLAQDGPSGPVRVASAA